MTKKQTKKQTNKGNKMQNEMATTEGTMPAYLSKDSTRGNEHVGQNDIAIPRIDIVQALSPCKTKSDPAYIEGITEGDFYNTVTREILKGPLTVIPVSYRTEYVLWKDRNQGGGFRGSFDNRPEAEKHLHDLAEDGLEVVETGNHFFLLVTGDDIQQVVYTMAKTKLKASRQLNTFCRMRGGDRFSYQYELEGFEDKNSKNQPFQNIRFSPMGWVSENQYKLALETYTAFEKSTVKVKVKDGDSSTEY